MSASNGQGGVGGGAEGGSRSSRRKSTTLKGMPAFEELLASNTVVRVGASTREQEMMERARSGSVSSSVDYDNTASNDNNGARYLAAATSPSPSGSTKGNTARRGGHHRGSSRGGGKEAALADLERAMREGEEEEEEEKEEQERHQKRRQKPLRNSGSMEVIADDDEEGNDTLQLGPSSSSAAPGNGQPRLRSPALSPSSAFAPSSDKALPPSPGDFTLNSPKDRARAPPSPMAGVYSSRMTGNAASSVPDLRSNGKPARIGVKTPVYDLSGGMMGSDRETMVARKGSREQQPLYAASQTTGGSNLPGPSAQATRTRSQTEQPARPPRRSSAATSAEAGQAPGTGLGISSTSSLSSGPTRSSSTTDGSYVHVNPSALNGQQGAYGPYTARMMNASQYHGTLGMEDEYQRNRAGGSNGTTVTVTAGNGSGNKRGGKKLVKGSEDTVRTANIAQSSKVD